jgi:hypothetical protein
MDQAFNTIKKFFGGKTKLNSKIKRFGWKLDTGQRQNSNKMKTIS